MAQVSHHPATPESLAQRMFLLAMLGVVGFCLVAFVLMMR